MTKKDFAKVLSDKGIFASKAEAEKKLDAIFCELEATLKTEKELSFIGFGKWEVVDRAERIGRNPKTGEEIKIKAKKSVKFKAGKKLVDSVN
ncbi:MAG: HU family DNA-binding protein [Fusobacteriaceae bacterium]